MMIKINRQMFFIAIGEKLNLKKKIKIYEKKPCHLYFCLFIDKVT